MRAPIARSARAPFVTTVAGACVCALAAAAEQPGAAPANEPAPRESRSAATAADASALSTVVVTAQRRSERLKDVAMAVAAFDGDALAEVGITDARQLENVVPSLTYVATGFNAQPYLRGVGTRSGWVGMESSVATYVDDRYVSRPWAAMFDVLDLQRVEVLKGPQGILYGRNAAGGAIRAITKDPGYDPSVEIGGKAGSDDYASLSILAGGPLSDALRGQIASWIEKRDGLATNLVPSGRLHADDLDRQSLRAKLIFDVGERVTAKLAASWWRYTDWIGRDLVSTGAPETNRGVALYGGVTSRQRDLFASSLEGDNDMRETAVDLRFDVAAGDLQLVSITTYTEGDFFQTFDTDLSSITLLDNYATETSTDVSQELQLLSARDGPLEWIAGAFYFRSYGDTTNVFRDSVSVQPQLPVETDISPGLQHADIDAYALYGQAAYAFNERWSVTFGSRWNRESKEVTLTAFPDTFTTAPIPFADSRDWNEVTPRASVEYRGSWGIAYLSYARGFKSGGYNYPASTGPALDPEILDSYELGLKSDLLDGRVQLRSAVFFTDVNGLQVVRGAAGALVTENAADADVRGLEVELDVALRENLSLSFAAALLDSEYTEYTAGVLVPLYVPPYGSAPLAGGLDVRGRSLLRTPDETLSVGVRYRKPLEAGGSIAFAGSYAYKGDYYFDFSAVPETEWLMQHAHGILNARAAYVASDERWELGFWSNNLTDELYYDDAVNTNVASRISYADPRTSGIDFKYRL
jgi:iron complex outermembrane receptor protein